MVKMSDTESDLEIKPSVVAYMAAAALREADSKATQDVAAAAAVHAQLSIDGLYEASIEMQEEPLALAEAKAKVKEEMAKCNAEPLKKVLFVEVCRRLLCGA